MLFFENEYFINGLFQLVGMFLAVAAGVFAISLFKVSSRVKRLWSWRILIVSLVFFGIHKVLSAAYAFNILRTPYLGQLIPFIIQALALWAVISQIQIVMVEKANKK